MRPILFNQVFNVLGIKKDVYEMTEKKHLNMVYELNGNKISVSKTDKFEYTVTYWTGDKQVECESGVTLDSAVDAIMCWVARGCKA